MTVLLVLLLLLLANQNLSLDIDDDDAAAAVQSNLISAVLVVGVEGSGQHLVSSIIEKSSDVLYQKKTAALDIFLSPTIASIRGANSKMRANSGGGSSGVKKRPAVQYPEKDPRVLAARIRSDPELKPVIQRAPFSRVRWCPTILPTTMQDT